MYSKMVDFFSSPLSLELDNPSQKNSRTCLLIIFPLFAKKIVFHILNPEEEIPQAVYVSTIDRGCYISLTCNVNINNSHCFLFGQRGRVMVGC
jgi:hypothetical protein